MRSKKTERFSRLHFGAGGKTSRKRPSAAGGPAHPGHTGSFMRFISAIKLWLFSTLPAVQFASRSAPKSEGGREARLRELQIRALEDEHELRQLQKREHEINIENGEIRRGLTLVAVVIVGAMVVAGVVLGVLAPGIDPPVPNLLEICRLLRW